MFDKIRNFFKQTDNYRITHENIAYEEGIKTGMKICFSLTSELSKEESELVRIFLERHNFVLGFDPDNGGFRVRKNNFANYGKETLITVIDKESEIGTKMVSLVDYEINKYNKLNLI